MTVQRRLSVQAVCPVFFGGPMDPMTFSVSHAPGLPPSHERVRMCPWVIVSPTAPNRITEGKITAALRPGAASGGGTPSHFIQWRRRNPWPLPQPWVPGTVHVRAQEAVGGLACRPRCPSRSRIYRQRLSGSPRVSKAAFCFSRPLDCRLRSFPPGSLLFVLVSLLASSQAC